MRVRQVFSHGDKVDNVRLRLSSNRGAEISRKSCCDTLTKLCAALWSGIPLARHAARKIC